MLALSPCSYTVFAKHWFWKRYCGRAGEAVLELETARVASRRFAGAEDGEAGAGGKKEGSAQEEGQVVMVGAVSSRFL